VDVFWDDAPHVEVVFFKQGKKSKMQWPVDDARIVGMLIARAVRMAEDTE
jgi:hypothetical protein